LLEQKITEQAVIIHSMTLGIRVAQTEQRALLHQMNKELRQHSVAKQEAVDDATKARDDLAFVTKKTATRIHKLERDVLNEEKEKIDMQTSLEGQLSSIGAFERDLAKRRRILDVQQDDLKKQQAASELQVTSLAFQKANIRTDRKKLKRSHSNELQIEQQTRAREKQVSTCPAFYGVSSVCIVSFLLPHDSLIVLLF
jgi:hypothetical protein